MPTQYIEYLPEDHFGAFLENKSFMMGRLIGSGSFGQVYKIVKVENPEIPLVIKISSDTKNTALEIKLIKKINQG
jgi:hypothetical protein